MEQLQGDLLWYLGKVRHKSPALDGDRCDEGEQAIRNWEENREMGNFLHPGRMLWFLHVSLPPKELYHWDDPSYDRQVRQLGHDEHVCEVETEDGTPCQFKGTLQQLGVHRYYEHKLCNPIEALVLTNQCPGCMNNFTSLKGAKEHANLAWKKGRCPTKKVARPYSFFDYGRTPGGTCAMSCV